MLESDGAAAMDSSIAASNTDDGSVAIGGTTANAIGENEDGAAAIAAGNAFAFRNDDGEMPIGTGNAAIDGNENVTAMGSAPLNYNENENGIQVVNPAVQDVQVGQANAKDTGIAQAQSTEGGSTAVQSGSGPALNNSNSNAFADGGVAATNPTQFAVTVGAGNSAYANDSAVAQGSVAAKDFSNAAISDSGPAAQASGNGNTQAQAAGNAIAATNNGNGAIHQGTGDAAVLNSPGAIAQGGSTANHAQDQAAVGINSKVISNPSADALIDSTQVRDGGQLAVGNVGGDAFSPAIDNSGATPLGVQTVALTQLKQVNAGVYVGNGSANTGGSLTANSTNSATNGVMATSNNFGGVAVNNASQNIVNVSANIGTTP
jgi:hypothetical protein